MPKDVHMLSQSDRYDLNQHWRYQLDKLNDQALGFAS